MRSGIKNVSARRKCTSSSSKPAAGCSATMPPLPLCTKQGILGAVLGRAVQFTPWPRAGRRSWCRLPGAAFSVRWWVRRWHGTATGALQDTAARRAWPLHPPPARCLLGGGRRGGTGVSLCRPCSQGPGAEGPHGAARGRWDRCIWPQLECTPPSASPAPKPAPGSTQAHLQRSSHPPTRRATRPPYPHIVPTAPASPNAHTQTAPDSNPLAQQQLTIVTWSSPASQLPYKYLASCLASSRSLQNQQTHEHSVLTTHPPTTHPGLPTPPAATLLRWAAYPTGHAGCPVGPCAPWYPAPPHPAPPKAPSEAHGPPACTLHDRHAQTALSNIPFHSPPVD